MHESRPGGPHLRRRGSELRLLQRPLPAVPASVRLARVTARVACRAWRVPDVADAAALVAAEMLAVALQQQSRGLLTLRVLMTPRRLRLELHDPSGRLHADLDPAADEPSRRTQVLAAVCVRWGVEPHGGGTQLFVELALPAPA